MALHYVFFAIPCLLIYLLSYTGITRFLCNWTINALTPLLSRLNMGVGYSDFIPYFGGVYFVTIPDKAPSPVFVLINLCITLLLLIIVMRLRVIPKSVSVYLSFALSIHLVSCLFFVFFADHFPYTLSVYSDLYIKQQVGIWLAFIAITGIIAGLIAEAGISRYILVFATMAYSFIFGCLRYVVFLVILSQFSSLYMAAILFVLGPFFDFLYLVCGYSIYMNALIIRFDDRSKEAIWHWS